MTASSEARELRARILGPIEPAQRVALYGRMKQAFAARETGLLTELGAGLADALPARDTDVRERARSYLKNLVPLLALQPDRAAVEAVLQLGARLVTVPDGRGHPDAVWRWLGALLGSAQDVPMLTDLLAARERQPALRALTDPFACWLHEKLLRGAALADVPEVRRFGEELRASRHVLGGLPLQLLEIEHLAPSLASSYGAGHASGWRVPLSYPPPPGPVWPAGAVVPRSGDVGTPAELAQIGAAWQSACTVSNGRSEARVRMFAQPLDGLPLAAELLCSLELACLHGVAPAAVELQPLTPAAAYGLLLALSSNGGDYNSAWSGAHGRLAAWQSLGALSGVASPQAPDFAAIEREARRCRWTFFRAPSPWFDGVVSDYALAAVRPDALSIAVLAATDSD